MNVIKTEVGTCKACSNVLVRETVEVDATRLIDDMPDERKVQIPIVFHPIGSLPNRDTPTVACSALSHVHTDEMELYSLTVDASQFVENIATGRRALVFRNCERLHIKNSHLAHPSWEFAHPDGRVCNFWPSDVSFNPGAEGWFYADLESSVAVSNPVTADLETPDQGHMFTITFGSRGSYQIGPKDGAFVDSSNINTPVNSVTVRAWNLRDALLKASNLPFNVLMADKIGLIENDEARNDG